MGMSRLQDPENCEWDLLHTIRDSRWFLCRVVGSIYEHSWSGKKDEKIIWRIVDSYSEAFQDCSEHCFVAREAVDYKMNFLMVLEGDSQLW